MLETGLSDLGVHLENLLRVLRFTAGVEMGVGWIELFVFDEFDRGGQA